MGGAKREMERIQALESQAGDVLLHAKDLRECRHGCLIATDFEPSSLAYAIGTNLYKDGGVDGSREEFMAAIKSFHSDHQGECYACAKERRE